MKLSGLLDLGQSSPALQELLHNLAASPAPTAPLGLLHSARPYVVALLARAGQPGQEKCPPLLVVTARQQPRQAMGR